MPHIMQALRHVSGSCTPQQKVGNVSLSLGLKLHVTISFPGSPCCRVSTCHRRVNQVSLSVISSRCKTRMNLVICTLQLRDLGWAAQRLLGGLILTALMDWPNR